MTVAYSDHQTSIVCPQCSTIPCQCSALTRALQSFEAALHRCLQGRHDVRQAQLGATHTLEDDPDDPYF